MTIINRRINFTCLFFLMAASVLTSLNVQAQDAGKSLRWKLTKGDQHTVIIKQDSLITTSVDGRVRSIDNRLTVTFDWATTNVAADGTATITQTISAVELHVVDETKADATKLNVKTVDLDTSKKVRLTGVSAGLMKQIQPLLDSQFVVQMSARGEILDVTIPEDTLEKLRNAPSSLQLRALFSAKGLKEILGQAAMVLPDETVKTGESWAASTPQNSPMGKFDRIHNYTYVGPEDVDGRKVERFDLKTELKPTDSDEPKKEMKEAEAGMASDDVPPELVEFTGAGKIFLDLEAGIYKSSEMKNSLKSRRKYRDKMIKTDVATTVTMSVEKK